MGKKGWQQRELGAEGGGPREEVEWEGVDDSGRPFGRERAIGMLTCHGKMISESMFGTVDGSVHLLCQSFSGYKKDRPRANLATWQPRTTQTNV